MTTVELLVWLVIGGVVGVLAGTFRRNEGITWTRILTLSMLGAVVGGLIGRTLFVPEAVPGEPAATSPGSVVIASLGALVALLIARFQLRSRERQRFS
jgi:uncharacterized membrane protein YeaQ/YmgE (transglycosylase-associated protein family)